MSKRKKLAAILCVSLSMLLQSIPVLAAEGTEITIEADRVQEGGGQIEVACRITGGQDVTNGKLLIQYDSSKAVLIENSAGDALPGVLCEINDCLTGNKTEGEIVVAFASSGTISGEGSLLDMTFEVSQDVKAGDSIDFSVNPEELAGSNGTIALEPSEFKVTVEEKDSNTPVQEPDNNPNDTEKDNKPDNDQDNTEKDNKADNDQNNTEKGKKQVSSSNNQQKSSGKTNGTASKSNPVKTGDRTNLFLPAAGICISLLSFAAVIRCGRKRNRNQAR